MIEKENPYDRMTGGKKRAMLDKLNEYRITPEILRRLVKHITCDICKKPIDDIEAYHFQWQRKYDLRAKCHGEIDVCSISELDFVHIANNPFQAVVFKTSQPDKLSEAKCLTFTT